MIAHPPVCLPVARTEADTLEAAGIESADVIIAASEDDANNLSIVMTAKELRPEIQTIARSSKEANKVLFKHAQCEYTLRRSLVVANEALTAISRPLVIKFIKFSSSLTEGEVEGLADRIRKLVGDREPVTWRLIIDNKHSPDLSSFIESGAKVLLQDISGEKSECRHLEKCLPLLLLRNGVSSVLPKLTEEVQIGDQILFCGARGSTLLPQRLQHNKELLDSMINQNPHYIPVLRWLRRRRG